MKQEGLYAQLMGSPAIYWQGEQLSNSQPKLTALLAYLAQEQNVSRQVLAEQFWNNPKSGSVRIALHRLKALPGAPNWLNVSKTHVSVNAKTDLHAIRNALNQNDLDNALKPLSKGLPKLLEGLDVKDANGFKDWQENTLNELLQSISNTVHKQIDKLEQETDFATAIRYAQILLGCDQLNESTHRMIMRLEHKRGNRQAALAQYEQCRRVLQEELGLDPIEETKQLLKDIERSGNAGSKRALILKTPQDVPSQTQKLIGRDQLLTDIKQSLEAGEHILLHGFGGTGKTSVAATVSATWLKTHPNALWLQAGHSNADALFDAVARALDSQQDLAQTTNKSETIRQQLIEHKISLIILDDLWNSYALEHFKQGLPNHLPLIVTARERHPKLKRFDIGKLKRQDALTLVSHYAKQKQNKSNKTQLNKLCQLLGDHPFTLRIAGVTLATQNTSPQELYKQIKNNPHDLQIPTDYAQEGRESVTSLLSVTLNAMSDAAHEALLAMGTLPTSSCTPNLLAHALRRTENQTENALAELQKRGSAERVTEPGSDAVSYRLHDLIYSFAKANKYLRNQTVIRASIDLLKEQKTNYDLLDTELNNLLSAAEIAKQDTPHQFIEIMKDLVVGEAYFVARGHTQQSIQLLEDAVKEAQSLELIEDAHYLVSGLGNGYRETFGQLDKALEAYQEALNLAKTLNNTHRQVTLLNVIGAGKFEKGESDYDDVLRSSYSLAKNAQDDLGLIHTLQIMGYISGVQEDYETSRKLTLESINVIHEIRKSKTTLSSEGDLEQRLFFSLLNLGENEYKLGNNDAAIKIREKALKLAQAKNNLLWIAYAHHETGEMFHELNNKEHAIEHLKKALILYHQNGSQADFAKLNTFLETHGYRIPDTLDLTM